MRIHIDLRWNISGIRVNFVYYSSFTELDSVPRRGALSSPNYVSMGIVNGWVKGEMPRRKDVLWSVT